MWISYIQKSSSSPASGPCPLSLRFVEPTHWSYNMIHFIFVGPNCSSENIFPAVVFSFSERCEWGRPFISTLEDGLTQRPGLKGGFSFSLPLLGPEKCGHQASSSETSSVLNLGNGLGTATLHICFWNTDREGSVSAWAGMRFWVAAHKKYKHLWGCKEKHTKKIKNKLFLMQTLCDKGSSPWSSWCALAKLLLHLVALS